MQSVTPRFLSALRTSHRVIVRVDAYLDGALIAGNLPVSAGSVSVDRTSGVRRQLTVSIPEAAILPTIGAQLMPYGVELVVKRGIDFGDGTSELVPLGVFRLDAGTSAQTTPTAYTGPDRAKALIDAKFTGPRQSTANVDAVSMITTFGREVIADLTVINVDVTNPETGGAVLPIIPQVFWDRERWEAMTTLAASLGAELFFNPQGELLVARTPTITNPQVWTIDQGAHGVLIDFSRELSREDTFNGVVVTGQRADGVHPVRAIALDDNPASPTEWGGAFGQVTYFYESALINTPNGAQRVADSLLADKVALSRAVRLSCVPNPALNVGDVIAVRMPGGVDEQHLIDRLTIPLDLTSPMQIETRTPDAVIVINDPPDPLPPVVVGPPYIPPPLPPIDIPPPVIPPPLPPPSLPPPLPPPPYIPGTPGDPDGPPGGTPAEYTEGFAVGAGFTIPSIHHLSGTIADSGITVNVAAFGTSGFDPDTESYLTECTYQVTGTLPRQFAIAVRERGNFLHPRGGWKLIADVNVTTEGERNGSVIWHEPQPERWIDALGIYQRYNPLKGGTLWRNGPVNGDVGFAVLRTSDDQTGNGDRLDLQFTAYALRGVTSPYTPNIRWSFGVCLNSMGNPVTIINGGPNGPLRPAGNNPLTWSTATNLSAGVADLIVGFYVDFFYATEDGDAVTHWEQSIEPTGQYIGTEPTVYSGLLFTGHPAGIVMGQTSQQGVSRNDWDAYGSVANPVPPGTVRTGYVDGVDSGALNVNHDWVSAWRVRGGAQEIAGGFWAGASRSISPTSGDPLPQATAQIFTEPAMTVGMFVDAIGIWDQAEDPPVTRVNHDLNHPPDWARLGTGIGQPPGLTVFQLQNFPVRTLPEAVVRLHNVVQDPDLYDIDYINGIFTVLPEMGAKGGDVVTIMYYADVMPPVPDPIPGNPQPVP